MQVSRSIHREVLAKGAVREIRQVIGRIVRDLCDPKAIGLLQGHAMNDHVHLCLSIPPKYWVAHTVGFLKGKSVVRIHTGS
jgi:putative transposase